MKMHYSGEWTPDILIVAHPGDIFSLEIASILGIGGSCHGILKFRYLPTVWPDDGIKSSQIYTKSCPKSSHITLYSNGLTDSGKLTFLFCFSISACCWQRWSKVRAHQPHGRGPLEGRLGLEPVPQGAVVSKVWSEVSLDPRNQRFDSGTRQRDQMLK